MERKVLFSLENIDDPKVDAFLNEILSVYEKHGMALEQTQGETVHSVRHLDKYNIEMLLTAQHGL